MSKSSNFLKAVIIFAVGLSIGVGLCGLDYLLASNGIGKSTEEFGVGPLDGVSLIVMFFSALGLLITLVAWLLAAIIGSMTSKAAETESSDSTEREPDDR